MLTLTYVMLLLAVVSYAIHMRTDRDWVGWLASGATTLAWGLMTGILLGRGLEAGHWPLANRYEFALCFVWAILAVYLLLEVSWGERWAGAFPVGMALLVATYAVTRPADVRVSSPLLPVLRSVWLQVHVLTAVVAYGALGVAAGLGLLRLSGRQLLSGELGRLEAMDSTIERTVALGFPWLTLSILTGAIWAQKAWGRYWGWDPKETWALITWLWYLLILHLLPQKRWRGRRLAALSAGGFAVVLFAFMGLPWLARIVRLDTLHGF